MFYLIVFVKDRDNFVEVLPYEWLSTWYHKPGETRQWFWYPANLFHGQFFSLFFIKGFPVKAKLASRVTLICNMKNNLEKSFIKIMIYVFYHNLTTFPSILKTTISHSSIQNRRFLMCSGMFHSWHVSFPINRRFLTIPCCSIWLEFSADSALFKKDIKNLSAIWIK